MSLNGTVIEVYERSHFGQAKLLDCNVRPSCLSELVTPDTLQKNSIKINWSIFHNATVNNLYPFPDIQQQVKDALYNMWKNCMSNDWLYDDDRSNFSVLEFYTELEWAKMLKGAIHITELSMISIFELLTIAGTGNKKIFIEGKKGVWCQLPTATITQMNYSHTLLIPEITLVQKREVVHERKFIQYIPFNTWLDGTLVRRQTSKQ